MLKIATFGVRGFLLLFGAVVLGLSVTLAKQQVIGSPPSETSFGSFIGAFGILISLIGFGALFFDRIPALAIMVLDGLASVMYLAGAIALTVALKSVPNCTDTDNFNQYQRYYNKLLNGGCIEVDGELGCPGADDNDGGLRSRCQRVQADYVFQYLAFVFGIAVIVMSFVVHRSGGSRTAAYV
ncbi:marvel domain-containing protein [Hypoxylon crocopeplum]|nr:marvel domain-containing protein [Hypoxylon crocopeplum]